MYYQFLIQQNARLLNNLSKILDKGAASADSRKFEMSVLLNDRIAPDMFPLIRQVQIACDTAKLGASRLSGKEAPKHEDNEQNLSDLHMRIQSTVDYLNTFKAEDFSEASDKKITQPRWEGKWLTGEDYLTHHVIPNISFHITAAYAILRKNGVDVGKKDYLGTLPFHS